MHNEYCDSHNHLLIRDICLEYKLKSWGVEPGKQIRDVSFSVHHCIVPRGW